MKPFLTSADWVLTSLIATTTKIRTVDCSMRFHNLKHFQTKSTRPATNQRPFRTTLIVGHQLSQPLERHPFLGLKNSAGKSLHTS